MQFQESHFDSIYIKFSGSISVSQRWLTITACLLSVMLAIPCAAAPRKQMTLPDLTKGEAIPVGADHDWTLGATGARGWMYSGKLETTDARQIAIT